jgi:hypothetical protein
MAKSGRDGARPVVRDGGRDSARIGDYSPNAKDNFCFERVLGYR